MKYIFLTSALITSLVAIAYTHVQAESTTTNPESITQANNATIEQVVAAGGNADATVNQQNTIIYQQEIHPTPTPEPVIVNENISVSITDHHDVVRPGAELNYRITLRNHLHQDLDNILIRLQVPQYVIPRTTEPEANTVDPDRRVIEWKQQQISTGSEVTFIVRGNAENGAPNQAELVATVLVNGPGVNQTAQDSTTIIDGAIAGAISAPAGPPVPTNQPAAIDVKPTAPTGIPGLSLAIGLLATSTGFWSTKRLLSL